MGGGGGGEEEGEEGGGGELLLSCFVGAGSAFLGCYFVGTLFKVSFLHPFPLWSGVDDRRAESELRRREACSTRDRHTPCLPPSPASLEHFPALLKRSQGRSGATRELQRAAESPRQHSSCSLLLRWLSTGTPSPRTPPPSRANPLLLSARRTSRRPPAPARRPRHSARASLPLGSLPPLLLPCRVVHPWERGL